MVGKAGYAAAKSRREDASAFLLRFWHCFHQRGGGRSLFQVAVFENISQTNVNESDVANSWRTARCETFLYYQLLFFI